MRQTLAYKILDIILLVSYRIGPEQTRLEMERIIREYFKGFDLVKASLAINSLGNNNNNTTTTTQSPSNTSAILNTTTASATTTTTTASTRRSAFKARTSIVSFDQSSNRRYMSSNSKNNPPGSNAAGSGNPTNELMNTSGGLTDLLNDSFDEYLKFSYDEATNEIVGSSLRPSQQQQASAVAAASSSSTTAAAKSSLNESADAQKYRTASFGLLSEHDNENDGNFIHLKKNLIF